MNPIEAVNQFQALAQEKDAQYDKLMSDIEKLTEPISNPDIPIRKRLECLISSEFLYTQLTQSYSFENIRLKQLLVNVDQCPSMKPYLQKRDIYLGSLSQQIRNIQDQISVLQKLVYYANLG